MKLNINITLDDQYEYSPAFEVPEKRIFLKDERQTLALNISCIIEEMILSAYHKKQKEEENAQRTAQE